MPFIKFFEPTFSSQLLEIEYQKCRKIQVFNFFKPLLLMFLLVSLMVIASSLLHKSYEITGEFGGILIICLLLWKISPKLQKYSEIIVLVLLCLISLATQIYFKTILVPPSCTIVFFSGYAYGTFERISMNGLARSSSKILYATFGMAGRFVLFPIIGVFKISAIIMHVVVVILGLVVDYLKDKEDRSRFKRSFSYREDLTKFKDLIVSGLQTNLVIISRDLQKELFSNQFLNKTLRRTTGDVKILHQWLERLQINHENREALKESPSFNGSTVITVFDLLKILKNTEIQEKLSFSAECLPNSPQDIKRRLYEINVSTIKWDTKESIAIILNDITERYLNQSLKIADSNKDKMLAMISHELRTPLNGILGVVRILEKQTKDQQTLQYLTICKSSGELLYNLVNSILDLQQIRDHKFSLKMNRNDLYELLNDVFGLFRFQFEEKGLSLNLEIAPDVPQYVVTDQNRLRQVLINLIGNALKFTYEGGVHVTVSLNPEQQGNINFSVKDTGIGIREEDQEKLFKMYGRVGNLEEMNKNTQGIGFGLEISDRLARLLAGGKSGISFASKFGEGASFSFVIKDGGIEKDHDSFELNFLEPHAFAENTENLCLKMAPYSFSLACHNEKLTKSGLFTPPSKDTKLHIPLRLSTGGGDRELERFVHHHQNFSNSKTLHSRQRLLSAGTPQNRATKENSPSHSEFHTREGDISLAKHMTCHSILLIDDNSFNLLVTKHLLEGMGYKVKTALNGKLAVDLVKKALFEENKKPFDVILMDLQMPVMDGYEATGILREMMMKKEMEEIPIIALSANDSEDDKRKCKEIGMVSHLSKPLKEECLREILERIFDHSFENVSELYPACK